jgi:hypothetical protein
MVAVSLGEDEREHELIVGRRWNVEETVAYALGEIASIDTPIQPGQHSWPTRLGQDCSVVDAAPTEPQRG